MSWSRISEVLHRRRQRHVGWHTTGSNLGSEVDQRVGIVTSRH